MSAINLFPFQARAADQIAARFNELAADRRRPWEHEKWKTPFYQALSALTGAGKTPILADAVAQIRASCEGEPVILWLSKAKAVVDQTRTNFEAGGKYAHLVEGFTVCRLSDLGPEAIGDASQPILALATVGSFNQKDKSDGSLRVHKVDEDRAEHSLWGLLGERAGMAASRRPLIVVYDEGHNLSDQQTEILLELEPDVLLVASATMRTPARLRRVIQRLRDYGWSDDHLVTAVRSKDVVEAGLVKRQIVLRGHATIMEATLDAMLKEMRRATEKAARLSAGFTPKAIYVCRTNISQEDGTRDNPARPFAERKAPPILIWRHLVQRCGVEPSTIASYCDLKFDRKRNPPPPDFVHFAGGEEDFAAFTEGGYTHIIFNQSLQEGWDDPECCFAYIDKSMGSSIQVEQVIGRVLRQPRARHYPDPDLNTANFYIRLDDRQSFPEILDTVRRRIAAEVPEVTLDGYSDTHDRGQTRVEPKREQVVPEIHVSSEDAIRFEADGRCVGPFAEALNRVIDYREGRTENISGKGEVVTAVQNIGDSVSGAMRRRETAHSNRVMARWVVRRAVQLLYPRVIASIDWSAGKFDAKVELTSPAATQLRESAEHLVDAFLDNSDLVAEETNPYTVGPVLLGAGAVERFGNALHEGYSGLNPAELAFARELDETGLPWVRNPVNGGYAIPLLERGGPWNFFPDFLVWKGKVVYALDPKGAHLIATAAGQKLLDVGGAKGGRKVVVRLITNGRWLDPQSQRSSEGYSVWYRGNTGQIRNRHVATVKQAVEVCLKPRL